METALNVLKTVSVAMSMEETNATSVPSVMLYSQHLNALNALMDVINAILSI